MRTEAEAAMRPAIALALIFLVAVIPFADAAVVQCNGQASAILESPNTNYEGGRYGSTRMRTVSNVATAIPYYQFDLSSSASDSSRFCANSAQWRVNALVKCCDLLCLTGVCYANDDPSRYPAQLFTVDMLQRTSWTPSGLTWNNQPGASSVLASANLNMQFNNETNYWYSLNIPVNLVNAAVKGNSGVVSMRVLRAGSNAHFSWDTSSAYKSSLSYTFNTCHPLAVCASGGLCTCQSGYQGDGVTSCVAVATTCPADNAGTGSVGFAYWPVTPISSTAQGTCIAGYSGVPKRQCTASGAWGAVTSACQQIRCPQVVQDNASWPQSVADTTVSGICLADFTGSPSRKCFSDGTWGTTSNPCIPRTCLAESAGNAAWPVTNAGNVASGTCQAGYSGSPTRVCASYGWGAISNACSMNICPSETFMSATWPITASNAVAVGSCVSGYSGSISRSCSASGTWSNTVTGGCSQIMCPATTADNAAWPSTPALSSATGTCAAYYTGTPSRECLASGSWSSTITNGCAAITCSEAELNGVTWPVTNAGSTASGVCPAGFFGSPTRACDATGAWQSVVNPCENVKCYVALGVNNSDWTESNAGTLDVSGTCTLGYSGTPKRDCLLSGEWGDIRSPCSRLRCAATSNDGNSAWPETDAGTSGIVGTCNAGFSGSPYRTCSSSGAWDTIINPCVAIQCAATTVDNAVWPATDSGQISQGVCVAGYTGSPSRLCTSSGTFSPTVTSPCTHITCPATTVGVASFNVTIAGTIAVGQCGEGKFGSPNLFCDYTGTWDTTVNNECSAVECAALSNNQNADWPHGTIGVASFGSCVAGFSGTPQRNCLPSGQWDSTIIDPCEPIRCYTNGSFVEYSATWPNGVAAGTDTVQGTCFPGYSGSVTRSCNIDGSWSALTSGTCTRITCPSANQGNAAWTTVYANTTAAGVCQAGYEGTPSRMCSITGTWNVISNPCTRIVCAASQVGGASFPATFANSTASGTCAAGYTGTPTRSCDITGVWSSTVDGACTGISCPAILNDGNADWPLSAAGSASVQGVCREGYSGAPTRQCSILGSWGSLSGTCTRNQCPPVTAFNAQWQTANSLTTSLAGACSSGFIGSPLRNCTSSGTWSPPSGTPCTQLVCPQLSSVAGDWPATLAGAQSTGSCPAGMTGSPTRTCSAFGAWTAVSAPCVALTCSAVTELHATWPNATAGEEVSGECDVGFWGVPVRSCALSGQWTPVEQPCSAISCPALVEGNADWPSSSALTSVGGTCEASFGGTPWRECLADGTWGDIHETCDALYCLGQSDNNAEWPQTRAGLQALGSCIDGFRGSPTRVCQPDGGWNISSTINGCTPIVPPCTSVTISSIFYPAAHPNSTTEGVCPGGFDGSPLLLCLPDGTWNGAVQGECHVANGTIAPTRYPRPSPSPTERHWYDVALETCASIVCPVFTTCAPRDGAPQNVACVVAEDYSSVAYWPYWVPLVALMVVMMGVYVGLRWKNREAYNAVVVSGMLMVANIALDVIVILSLRGSMLGETIFAVAVAFLGITLFANMATIFLIFRKVLSSSRHLLDYLESHIFIISSAALVSVTHTSSLSVLNSQVLNAPVFDARWRPSIDRQLFFTGLLTNLLEDIPQIVVQVYVAYTLQSLPPVLIISFALSATSLLSGIISRVLALMGVSVALVKKQAAFDAFKSPSTVEMDEFLAKSGSVRTLRKPLVPLSPLSPKVSVGSQATIESNVTS